MGILNVIKHAEKSVQDAITEDVRLTLKEIYSVKRIGNPVINYESIAKRNGSFNGLEYDLAQIERFTDAESLLAQSFRKKVNLFLKEGYEFFSEEPEYASYVKKRINQICLASGTTERQLLEGIVTDLEQFSNCFIAVTRNVKASGGVPYKMGPKEIKPIAGLFILPAPTMELRLDDKNQIIEYRQYVKGTKELYKIYKKDDIIHLYINKKKGLNIGTPKVLPVLEDIMALRRIEENVEMLVIQNIFPLIHYKVGTESMPATTDSYGINEVDKVIAEVEHMPAEGIFVTPERHEIKMIGTEGRALRVEAYIDYFKKRVLAGLSLSGIDIGDGGTANRSTADTMSRALIDEVKGSQKAFEELFRHNIINQLLLESGQEIDLNDTSQQVFLRFNEIDYDTKIKVENHILQKWLNSVITLDEVRNLMGMNVLMPDQMDGLYHKMITESQALMTSGDPGNALTYANAENENTPLSKANIGKAEAAVSKLEKQKAQIKAKQAKQNKTVANKNRPSNQHGTKSSSKKSLKDGYQWMEPIEDSISELKQYLLSNTARRKESNYMLISIYGDKAKESLSMIVKDNFYQGLVESGVSFINHSDYEILKRFDILNSYSKSYVEKLFGDIRDSVSNNDLEDAILNIDSISYRMKFIERTEAQRAYNWGYVSGLYFQGKTVYNIDIAEDSDLFEVEACKKDYNVKDATLRNIPPWHPNSTLKIVSRRA